MSSLNETDSFWLRLWAWRHRGSTIQDLPFLSKEELHLHGLEDDPWPLPSHINRPEAKIPDGVPSGNWEPVRSGSRRVQVFFCEDLFLRVATPNSHEDRIAKQVAFLKKCGSPAPELVSYGDYWLVTKRISGSSPANGGPWLDEMFEEFKKMNEREELLSLLPSWTPETSMLSSVLPTETVSALKDLADMVPKEFFVSHGDLQAQNVLVADGKLSGIVDFEAVAAAPVERDAAIWLTALMGQVGVDVVRSAFLDSGIRVRPMVLAGCLVHSINKAAASASRRFDPFPYATTVRCLAEWLVANPEGPYNILVEE